MKNQKKLVEILKFLNELQQNLNRRRMRFWKFVKDAVKSTDFFYSAEMLRYEEELQYRTMTGGILSLGIIIATLIGFASMIIDTLNLQTINTQRNVIKSSNPTESILSTHNGSNFMFGIQIWTVDITGPKRYFDVRLNLQLTAGQLYLNYSQLPLETCTKDHWSFMPETLQNYEKLNIGNWLCAPLDANYTIFGKYSSSQYQKYVISVEKCRNQTDPSRPCASQEEIDQLFTDYESNFYLTFYYSNPVINSQKKQFKSYYLEDQNYLIFGNKVGAEAFVCFTDYTISTDNSIWPYEHWQNDEGLIVQSLSLNHPYQTVVGGYYANINIVKSANSITYKRQVQKISSVLSFIGGMIGAVSALLFFIKIYTNLSFQLQIATSLFTPDENSGISRQDISVNAVTFFKYYLFRFLLFLGCTMQWKTVSYISDCQKEVSKQLDIKTLIKRLIFAEYCLTHLFQDYQIEGLKTRNPKSPSDIKVIREKMDPFNFEINDISLKHDQNNEKNIISPINEEIAQNDPNNKQVKMKRSIVKIKSIMSNFLDPNQDNLEQKLSDELSCNNFAGKKIIINSLEQNKVNNEFFINRKRQQGMKRLHADAENGNIVSIRIWSSISSRNIFENINQQIIPS